MNEDIERLEAIKKAATPVRRQLSGGDAVVIIGLLLFIPIWVGGWLWGLVATDSLTDTSVKWYVWVVITIAIVGPALWAADVIKHITGKDD